MRKILTIIMLLPLCSTYAKTKNIKIGCADMARILESLPQTKKAQAELEIFSKQLEDQIRLKFEEFQSAYSTFQKASNTMSENTKKQKQIEIQLLQNNIEQLKIKSEESLAEKRTELIDPIINNVLENIKKIAKQHGYTHIMNKDKTTYASILYIEDNLDITNLVMQAMNKAPQTQKK